MPKAQQYLWNGAYRSADEIAQIEEVTPKQVYNYLRAGYHGTNEIPFTRRRKKTGTIVAARIKPELPKPVKVNENCIIRIRHPKLRQVLEALAKQTGHTYQTASEAFISYVFEGHLWGQDSFSVLRERLLGHKSGNGNGHYEEAQGFEVMPEEKKTKAMEILAAVLEENDSLREKNEGLQAELLRANNLIRKFRNLVNEAE